VAAYKTSKVSSPNIKIEDSSDQPTVGVVTEGTTFDQLNVAYTPASTGGRIFRAVSNPGGLVGVSTTSPIPVTNLVPGTNYTFTVSGANGGPSSSASASNTPTGAIVPIATSTLSSSGGFSFTNIPQFYQDLELIVFTQYAGSGDFGSYMNFNNNAYGSVTSWTTMYNSGSSLFTTRATNAVDFNLSIQPGVESTNIFSAQRYKIFNYSSISRYKNVLVEGAVDKAVGGGYVYANAASYRVSAPITVINFGASSYINLTAGSKATLYGIKGVQ
jgi:hypothetical protein